MKKDASAAIARLCRQYVAFLEHPNEDSLFNWSNALHSLHDRVPLAMKQTLFAIPEFVAMKALRNHFHHGGEIAHRIKVLSIGNLPLTCDLPVLCLIERVDVVTAIQAIPPKYKAVEQPLAEKVLKWYGPCVNVNPAIFNLMVQIVLLAQQHGVVPHDESYVRLADAIDRDKSNGDSITVTGDIHCHANSVDQVLASIMAK